MQNSIERLRSAIDTMGRLLIDQCYIKTDQEHTRYWVPYDRFENCGIFSERLNDIFGAMMIYYSEKDEYVQNIKTMSDKDGLFTARHLMDRSRFIVADTKHNEILYEGVMTPRRFIWVLHYTGDKLLLPVSRIMHQGNEITHHQQMKLFDGSALGQINHAIYLFGEALSPYDKKGLQYGKMQKESEILYILRDFAALVTGGVYENQMDALFHDILVQYRDSAFEPGIKKWLDNYG